MKKSLTLLALNLLTLGFLSTTNAQSINAVATIGMIGDVVSTVGGDCVNVTTIMGPGVDPHLYKASASDVRTFQQADIIFYSGYHLEGQLAEVLENFAKRQPTIAVAEAGIDESLVKTVENSTATDPHVWMDVSLWANTIPVIAQELASLTPDCTDAINERANAYQTQLESLHAWIAQSIASIPDEQRILITAHDAFEYYGRAYGIEVDGIQGISTASEASLADIRDVANLVTDRKVPAIFVESSINPSTIEAVRQAVRDRGFEVEIGGQLYSDAMGQDGSVDGTYLGMLYKNTKTITESLGGTLAPLPDALIPWADEWNLANEGVL